MSNKPVSLSVHRNTRDQRRRHETSKLMVEFAKDTARSKDVDGFVIVAWTNDRKWTASWSVGDLGLNAMPDFVHGALRRKMGALDAHDEIYGAPEDDSA